MKVKFSTLGVSVEEKRRILEKVNELRRKRSYEEYNLYCYVDYDYLIYNENTCELIKVEDISVFKHHKAKKINPVEFFLSKNNDDFENKIDKIFKNMKQLLIKKHHDYGNSNLEKYGEFGILVRISDKISRLEQKVINKKELMTDSHEDIYKDLIGYATQALIMLEDEKE